ncbi:MAG TPA: hypothetical protein VLQ45_10775 [Thermoanaerobaculia bacterium]|nr:hypothetical protein [Thermoanaerobaculia bacterium]
MAFTLTEERRVAWKIQGIGPDPAHTLVVFKKVGTGKILHGDLKPGEPFKPGWFKSADSYVAYAISNSENLRHSFSQKYQWVDQTKTFTLHFDLSFRVSEPKVLAVNMEGGDPLKNLEEEVARVLGVTARYLPWEVLQRESSNFGFLLLGAESAGEFGQVKRNLDHIREFASKHGLDLRHIDVTRSLTEKDLKIPIAENEVATQIGLAALQSQLVMAQGHLKYQQETLQDQHQWDRTLITAQRNQVLEGMARLKGVLDTVAKESSRAITQGVSNLHSFGAINEALPEILRIQSTLMALWSGTNSVTALGTSEAPVLPASQNGPLLAEVRRPSDPLERLVTQAFQHLRILDGNPADKRRILGALLHLVAEAALGHEGDEEYLEGYRETLKQQLYPLESALEEEQRDFLRKITDLENLRQELA